eukprot:5530698-Pyramimonas_sp.AAC.1
MVPISLALAATTRTGARWSARWARQEPSKHACPPATTTRRTTTGYLWASDPCLSSPQSFYDDRRKTGAMTRTTWSTRG